MSQYNSQSQHTGKSMLVNRLFDRGVHLPMPSISKQVFNDRPLTAKIAVQVGAIKALQFQKYQSQTDQSKLPPISETSQRPNSVSRNVRPQLSINRGKSLGVSFDQDYSLINPSKHLNASKQMQLALNSSYNTADDQDHPSNSRVIATPNNFDDKRNLIKSRQVMDLMDKMIGKSGPVAPVKEIRQTFKRKTLTPQIVDAVQVKSLIVEEAPENDTEKRQQVKKKKKSKVNKSLIGENVDESEDDADKTIFKLKDVDTFIQMIREHKLSPMEFIYLVKSKQHTNDAYNMRVVSYHYIQVESIKNYYTLSAKGLTRYENNIPIEFVLLGDWLKERDQFNAIKSLSFFRKFRMWKTLRKWCKIIYQNQSRRIQQQLSSSLLILNPIYQKLLLKHRFICCEFECLRFVDVSETGECLTLAEFQIIQQNQRKEVVNKLEQYSTKMHDNCKQGLKLVIDKLRTQITSEMTDDDDQMNKFKSEGKQAVDERKVVLEGLGFPDNMSYGHRALMRSEFVRFLRLAYLLDFVAVQSLGYVYISSATEFLQKFSRVADCCTQQPIIKTNRTVNEEDEMGDRNRKMTVQDYDPIYKMELKWKGDTPLEFLRVEDVEVRTDTLYSQLMDFDLEHYAQLNEVEPEEQKKQEKKLDEDEEEPEFAHKRVVPNLHRAWLEITPSQEDFFHLIQETFTEGLDSIQVLERWSKHPQFLPYVQALEEWDEIIGEKWTKADNNYLNPQYWIKEHPLYSEFLRAIQEDLDTTFQRLETFKEEFTPVMTLVWRVENSDLMVLKDPALRMQQKVFTLCLRYFQYVEQQIRVQLITTADLGLFRVHTEDIQKVMLARQQGQFQRLEELLMGIFRKRAAAMKVWLQQSIRSLTGMVIKIEEFVEQKNSVDRITRELPHKRQEIEIASGLLSVMLECNIVSMRKEDKELAQELNFLEGSLNVALSEADNNTAKNIDRFKKTLRERIDKLKIESIELQELVMRERYLLLTTPQEEAVKELMALDEKLKVAETLSDRYGVYEQILQCQETAQYEVLEESREQLNLRLSMWKAIDEFKQLSAEWIKLPFNSINARDIASQADNYVRIVMRCEKNLQDNKVVQYLKKIVWEFKDTIPVVVALRSPFLQADHWVEIKRLVKADFDVNDSAFTLQKLLTLNVAAHHEQISEVSVKAAQEDALNAQLRAIETQWAEVEVTLKPYKDTTDTLVVGDVDDILQQLDEGLASMSNILASRYVRPLRPRAEKVQSELLMLSDIVDKWVECQKKWMYLESIFSSQDIKKQLSNESQQFDVCDKTLRKLIKQVNLKPQILKLLTIPGLVDNLTKTSESLDIIEKSLEDYLEVKRAAFPRFYFLSNDELLEILAKQTNIDAIQQHLAKCFEGIVKLHFGDKSQSISNFILGIVSPENEQVMYYKPILARGNVETWLDALQKEMVETLRKLTKLGMLDYMNGVQRTRNEWILEHKAQIVSTVSQILWSINTEDAINESASRVNALYEWYEVMVTQLSQLTQLVRGDLTSIQRKTIVALITTDVHNRDTVGKLAEGSTESPFDFQWQQQLRYYWDEEADDCLVKQVTSVFCYGYEYMGATSRLVITPLTDRCWITITSALTNQLGAAPAGPAGTGKTESTKDLAKGLGRLCIVFNCSDQITAATMNKLFSGLVQQGAWTCLDEFNRIDIEVLSVIAQQLLVIRMALIAKQDEFLFDGRMIVLKQTCGVFITMNPGYAGRTELPDNLKSQFRPVAMMIPDYRLIAEIMLYAEGFENANSLSRKMVQLYKLSSEQLSQQDHYDFGMRAVKSLLVMAGSLKRAESTLSEDVVLIRAMRDSNIPKFLKDDLPLFSALIQDLFPGVQLPSLTYGLLETVIRTKIDEMVLQPNQAFVTKVLQLFDTLNVRFGSMIVGPSGAGKSQCFKVLAEAMIAIKQEGADADPRYQYVKYQILNPKAIDMGELYGSVDPFTNEWKDGLASSLIRECNTKQVEDVTWDAHQRHWIIFDGPVDALWIENMNSVLDDSVTLCLANSERIKLRQELRMIFEVQDLAVASPATVSRCGMVYMTPEDLGWEVCVKSWMQRTFQAATSEHQTEPQQKFNPCTQLRPKVSLYTLQLDDKYQEQLQGLFFNQFQALLSRVQHFQEPFPTVEIQRAQNVCNILEKLIWDLNRKFGGTKEDLTKKLNYLFTYAVIWGLGGSLDQAHHDKLEHLIKEIFSFLLYPKCDGIFDFFVDPETMQAFTPWEAKLEEFIFSKELPYFQLMVPTTDTTKFSHIMQQLLDIAKPILLTGHTGVGKSIVAQSLLYKMKDEANVSSIYLNFSAQTKPPQTQLAIEAKLNKKGKTLFGARPNEKIAIFIDDVNMPALEQYGAQPCIELLRQLQDLGGFYDRSKLFWKNIEDTSLVCAGGPPGGGRNQLTQRFLRQFNIFNMPQPSDNTLMKIFGSILKGFLSSFNFSDAVRKMHDATVYATIEMYRRISKELLPIPSKFHYTFNLRDISKVFQGILMVRPNSVNSAEMLARLWCHETSRVFADRLVCVEDRLWFQDATYHLVCTNMRMTWTKEDLFRTNILFSDILKLEATTIFYEEVTEKRKIIIKALEDKQGEYVFSTNDKLDLVFFDDALEHILRISRIFRQPRGNGMLIGVGGSGKQSLAKLASFLMKCDVFQIELVKTYNTDSFRGDLIKMTIKCGVDRKALAFIFTDVQIAYESFLEDINNLLNTGEVPNLFSKKEDLETIYNGVRAYALLQKRPDSPEALWNCFVDGVRDNLHIVLCMSPVGEDLRVRCRKFPSLVNCCTLDWFSNWPREALLEVANKFLDKMSGLGTPQNKEAIAQLCTDVSVSVESMCEQFYRELRRRVYTTPKSYLDQIKLYSILFTRKQAEYANQQQKLSDGLGKLFKTNETVFLLKKEMETLKPQLLEQQTKTEIFLKQLALDQGEANQKERFVNDEAQIVNAQALEIKIIADEAQAELDKALPALKEAEDALSKINKNDIAEIKGFINPPAVVVLVLEAVCVLLGEKFDWASAKQVMMSIDFLERLQKYDKNSVSDMVLRRLRALTNKPEFDPVFVGQKSQACKSLCLWARAIDNYSKVAKEVEPKKKKVADMQSKLDLKNKELMVKQDELQKVRDKVAKLQKECDETVDKKNKLVEELERTQRRCLAAEKLTLLLADEGIRWKNQIEILDVTLQEIIGDIFISAAIISYLGAFTAPYRDILVRRWLELLRTLEVPCSQQFSLSGALQTPIEIRDWIMEGLPNDQLSVDNAVITTKCDRWPLMIDPQGEANKWIKVHESLDELKVLRFTEPHFLKSLQLAVSSGYPVLFEEVDERLEPSIDSVLQRQILEVDGRKLIRVGDQRTDYHPNFRLYLTCKQSNPHFLPEVFIKVTVINFSITFEGLQDQLLGDVMKNERPEIERQRDEITVKMGNARKQLKQAQDRILELLAEAKGMILDDVELIATLEQSKQQSEEIAKSLEESSIIENQINDSRNMYLSVAIRGTVLYFVISEMSGIDPMYQYSLQYFKKVFRVAMEYAQKSELLQERLMHLEDRITRSVYTDICRGLFESHKKIFSFLICTSIRRQAGIILPAAWNLLLRGGSTNDPKNVNPDKTFFKEPQWQLLCACSEAIPDLQMLASDIKLNLPHWKEFSTHDELYQEGFPLQSCLSANDMLNPFYRLLIVKALRPEKLMQSFSNYVAEQLGHFFDEVPITSMEDVYQDSDQRTPVIFILSSGADPTQMLFKLARDNEKILEVISLGQGQGRRAEVMIERAEREGGWVLLQNCHLAKSWMNSLELLIERLVDQNSDVKPQFRLFLTSMPASYFPVSVLQNGIKLTTEPPRGLKANLKRSYNEFSQSISQTEQMTKAKEFKSLIFSISFFHAIVQERRKFGPLGFNKAYEFNDSDLDISLLMMKMFVSTEEELPWDAMQYMIGQINYGGRVTDDWDRACLMCILKNFVSDHIASEEKVRFSSSGTYFLPVDATVEEFKKYIDQLPNSEDPEVFGMHENANIAFEMQESLKMLDTILSIQPRLSGEGGNASGKSPDDIVSEMAAQFEVDLPTKLSREVCNAKHFLQSDTGSIGSLSTVLFQEMDKFNKLLELLTVTLQSLQKAIKGFVVMSSDLDEMYLAFLNNQIPSNWRKVSYATLKPLASWFKDLIQRVAQMKLWMERDWIQAYWMSGLFYPQGFLTGVLQTNSRKYKVAIDKLNFRFKFMDVEVEKVKEEPKDGVYVWGLYLEAARWDSQHETLVDQSLGQLAYPLPLIHFQPMENYTPPQDYYRFRLHVHINSCPCYKTSNRVGVLSTTGQSTNFILSIDLPSKHEKSEFWTLRGTAMLSQQND